MAHRAAWVPEVAGPLTVAGMLREQARRFPDRAALADLAGFRLTYAQLLDRGARRASALLSLGLHPGDRIAAWMDDGTDYVELYVACALAGLVVVPCNARFTPDEVSIILEDSEPSALICCASRVGPGGELAVRRGVGIVLDSDRPGSSFAALLEGGSPAALGVPIPAVPQPDDLFIIGYTSGTTGRPKGAMLTHRSVLAISSLNAVSYRLRPHSVTALTGSMSFVSVVPAHIITHFSVAGTVILPGSWTTSTLIEVIREHAVDFVYIPSPLVAEFAERVRADPSSVASVGVFLHSGSKVSPACLQELVKTVGPRLCEGWGMTENSGGLMTATRPADLADPDRLSAVLSSVGRAAMDTVVEVVDAAGMPLPHDGVSVGELTVRSPALMAGYWRRPEDTKRTLRDGVLFSGDLGSIDERGLVYISDRRTDLIVSGGMNVYPSEVEECIRMLPGVADVGVVGLPHERWGATVVAAIVREAGASITAGDVVAHCRRHLAGYKKPTDVRFVDELPRTTSLKLSRGQLRDALDRGAGQRQPAI